MKMIQNQANLYQSAYMRDYGFEKTMVKYRQRFLIERLQKYKPQVVIEIGCGMESLYQRWHQEGYTCRHWITIEPADGFAEFSRETNVPGFHLINDYFENSIGSIKKILTAPPDLIICSSVLHEVDKPDILLNSIYSLMTEHSVAHINVPNASSFHRQLALAMNLITDVKEFSTRNKNLMQQRVYDLNDLTVAIQDAGLSMIDQGGYFIKPFTHQQMQSLNDVISDDILNGLYVLGKNHPMLASEIFIDARKAS